MHSFDSYCICGNAVEHGDRIAPRTKSREGKKEIKKTTIQSLFSFDKIDRTFTVRSDRSRTTNRLNLNLARRPFARKYFFGFLLCFLPQTQTCTPKGDHHPGKGSR